MSEKRSPNADTRRARRPRAAKIAIVITALACVAALVFRAPLRARYWALRVANTDNLAERETYLAGLCNAGDDARWGVAALVADDRVDVRQCGVLVLHCIRSGWARDTLLTVLDDQDDTVRSLAAGGLAVHGDDRVIRTLTWMYRTGEPDAGRAACLALQRLGSPAAIEALYELAAEPADAERRTALVDAFAGIGIAECVPGLRRLLSDDRPCGAPPQSAEMASRVLGAVQREGLILPPSSQPRTAMPDRTIAEYAADVIESITGGQRSADEMSPTEP